MEGGDQQIELFHGGTVMGVGGQVT
jgi:hypothetical protein